MKDWLETLVLYAFGVFVFLMIAGVCVILVLGVIGLARLICS